MRTSSVLFRSAAGIRRMPPVAVAVAGVLLAASAAGCGSSSGQGSASGTSAGPSAGATAAPTTPSAAPGTAAPSTTPAPSATPAPSGGRAPSAAPAGSTRCTVGDLKLRIGRGDPGAGQVYYPLTFTNVSAHPCTLDGYPGVSLLRGDGSVIGRPAGREGGRAAVVRLAPGRSVEADLHTLNQGVREGGCWHAPAFVKVYPPGSTESVTLAVAAPVVCGGTFGTGPVH